LIVGRALQIKVRLITRSYCHILLLFLKIYPTNFKGNVEIQASLAETPTSSDWFNITLKNGTVAQYNLDGTVDAYTFTGNFIYLRARVTPEATNIGSVDKILLNY
jgi:hypothetical protein